MSSEKDIEEAKKHKLDFSKLQPAPETKRRRR